MFCPAKLGPLEVKNRIIRSATHEGMGDTDGRPTELLGALYERLAKGGVGTIVTGYASVSRSGRTCNTMRMFDDDRYIAVYKPIVARVKAHETAVILQIAHGGAFAGMGLDGVELVAPSEYRVRFPKATARALREEEIESIINDFVDAIERAQMAGFDGVQLHAAHVYLLSQFLSPHINRRRDRFGGSTENRFRIVAEIMARARKRVGRYPIYAKFSAYSFDKGGVTEEEGLRIAEQFELAGIDGLEVSSGGMTDLFNPMRVPKVPTAFMFASVPELQALSWPKRALLKGLTSLLMRPYLPLHRYNVSVAERIKKRLSIPITVVGGIRSKDDIEDILTNNRADFVAMSRPFIHSPNLVRHLQSGKITRSRCSDCGHCLFSSIRHPVRCWNGTVPAR